METVKKATTHRKTILERYKGQNNVSWIRLKCLDNYGTEVIMAEKEFERCYGKLN